MKLRNAILYTSNIARAKQYYKQLGFNLVEDFEKFISFETEDKGVLFSINLADEPTKIPGKQTVIFSVQDLKTEYKKMQSLKATINQDLYEAPFGYTFSIRDLDGNKIEFVQA